MGLAIKKEVSLSFLSKLMGRQGHCMDVCYKFHLSYFFMHLELRLDLKKEKFADTHNELTDDIIKIRAKETLGGSRCTYNCSHPFCTLKKPDPETLSLLMHLHFIPERGGSANWTQRNWCNCPQRTSTLKEKNRQASPDEVTNEQNVLQLYSVGG